MPHFAQREIVGDFDIEVKPVGRFREKPLIRQFAPYFAGTKPKMKLIIKKAKDDGEELVFNAEIRQLEPVRTTDILPSPIKRLDREHTPFEGEIKGDMLTDNGNYLFELHLGGVEGKGGRSEIAHIPVITVEFLFVKLLYLVVGAIIGAILGTLLT